MRAAPVDRTGPRPIRAQAYPATVRALFNRFAKRASAATGRPLAFVVAAGIIVVWATTGPIFDFNDTWQLVINTGTTIVTFLMVFLIQNSQNRDTAAIQLKLDELISVITGADDRLLDLEELDEKELEAKRARYEAVARAARGLPPET